MTFLAPFFLLATLAVSIPVILHMINRQKAKDMAFPTLRFLIISEQKTRNRRRIHDVALMLVRAAVLLLIALGLSRPTITNLSALLGGGNSSAVAIILDNSASMGVMDTGRPRLDTALSAANQIIGQLAAGDDIVLYLTGGQPRKELGRLDHSPDEVLQVLTQCSVSYQRADLAGKLDEARKTLLTSQAPNKQIYVLTDQQKVSWEGLKKKSDTPSDKISEDDARIRKIPVIIVDCSRQPQPNSAVNGLDIEATLPVAGLPIKATAEVFNASSAADQRQVDLYVDEAKEASSPALKLDPQGRANHTFVFTCKRAGLHRCEVRLVGEDGSKYDDRRFFTVDVDQGIPVAVVCAQRNEVAHQDDAFYLQSALAPTRAGTNWAIKPTIMTTRELAGESLSKFTAIYCVNLPAPDADLADRLRAYVEGGGNLVWILGDNVQPEAYNQMNRQAQEKLLPAMLLEVRIADGSAGRDSWRFNSIDKQHKALAPMAEPASLYQSVLVYKHIRMAADKGGCAVLARLDDNEPILVERRGARGGVTMLGTSAQLAWTNLPLRPFFLPLIVRYTFELAGAEQTIHRTLAGSPIVLSFDEENHPITVEVVTPTGAQNRLPTKQEEGRRGQTFRYEDTFDVGVYTFRALDAVRPRQVAYSVNFDPDEANPAKIEREEFSQRFGSTNLIFADDPEDLSSTFKTLREGKNLWSLFLILVLLALVFEAFLSNRLTPRQEDQAPAHIPPGMRRLAKVGQQAADGA